MRIDRLDLIAYGPFTGTSLDLSEGSAGLHLIYGDNEAGKSTSLRALIAWLFGIAPRTADNFLHAHPQLRIGGRLRLADGRALEFVRRKGNKDTLLEPGTDAPLDESVLEPFLPGGMDEALFARLYGIDHGRLVAGGRELLAQSGDLGQALFSAAVGTAGLRNILAELKTGAEELYKPRASTKPVNRAIDSFKEARNRIRESTLSVAEWKRLQADLADTRSLIEQVEAAISGKNKEKSRLDRLARVRGALAERRQILAQIDELGEVRLLPEDFDARLKSAEGELQAAAETRERNLAKLVRLNAESESLNVRTELLENDETIQSLYQESGAVEKAVEDRRKQEGKRRLLQDEAETLLKSVRPDVDPEDADRLRPLLNNKSWISNLGRRHGLLAQRKEQAESSLRDIEQERAAVERELAGRTRPGPDVGGLKATVAAARKAGDVERRLTESRSRASSANADCEDAFARLGRFAGTGEMLLQTAMPLPETLDAFEKRFDEIAARMREASRRRKELEEEKALAVEALKALLSGRDLTSLDELEESRAARDAGWRLIKRKYIENADVEREIRSWAGDSDPARLYENRVAEADRISDRLRSGADQVVKRADLEAKIGSLESRLVDIAEEMRGALESDERCRTEWASIWGPLHVDPATPREMKQWVLRAEKLAADIRSADAASRETEKLLRECEALKGTLSRHIAGFDDSVEFDRMGLESMIQLCEQKIEQEERALERERQLEYSLSEMESRWKRTQEEIRAIRCDQAAWEKEWSQAVEGLGADANMHPEQAADAFEKLALFFEKLDKSGELEKRISGMDRVARLFQDKVFEFADHIGFEREGREAVAVAVELNRKLAEAREARASLDRIEKQAGELREEIENASFTGRAAGEKLAALRDLAGARENSELGPAGERSGLRRELVKKLDTLEQELSRNGDGLSVSELEREARESDIDAIDGELQAVGLQLRELQKERDALRDRQQTLCDEIQAKDGSAVAAGASEEAELQLAALVSAAEQYLRLQIAALILEQRIENYRKENQAPVLARAGALFSRLTLMSYAGLRDELDEVGNPVLVGVRPDDREVPVGGMSDGSRDQLYLALRLATLEQHLGKGEPMPFVVDDILIGFDDSRTAVCLEVLAELAIRTQVLVFTHHRKVVELGQTVPSESGIFVHELNPA